MKELNEIWLVNTVAFQDGLIYFIGSGTNILYSLSLKTSETKKMATFPTQSNLWSVYKIHGRIYCCHLDGISVFIFDELTGEIRKIESDNRRSWAIDTIFCNGKIVFLPRNLSDELYEFDIHKNIFLKNDLLKKTGKIHKFNGRAYVWNKYNDIVCYVTPKRDEVVICDYGNQAIKKQKSPISEVIKDAVCVGEKLYLIYENDSALYEYDIKNKEITLIKSPTQNENRKLIAKGQTIFLVCDTTVKCYNGSEIFESSLKYSVKGTGSSYINALSDGNNWIFLPWVVPSFAILSNDLCMVKEFSVSIPFADIMNMKKIIIEGEISLSEFIEGVSAQTNRISI